VDSQEKKREPRSTRTGSERFLDIFRTQYSQERPEDVRILNMDRGARRDERVEDIKRDETDATSCRHIHTDKYSGNISSTVEPVS
jgi:hypothetical protein